MLSLPIKIIIFLVMISSFFLFFFFFGNNRERGIEPKFLLYIVLIGQYAKVQES